MEQLIVTLDGLGLAIVAFVGATLVPLSSEAALYGAVHLGMSPLEAFVYATIGNMAGVAVNYWLGYMGSRTVATRFVNGRLGRKATDWSNRYGKWSLLLSWLPLVGDPLTVVAGVMRVNIYFFIVVTFVTRMLRYAALLALM